MSSEWEMVSVGEICEVYDGPHATPERTDAGPIFLGISSLDSGRIDLERSDHIGEEDFIQWTRRVVPVEGDIVFSYETRLGEAGLIPKGLRCCLGRRMGLLRARNKKRVDPKFLLYNYLGPAYQAVISERTIFGSTVDRIPLKDVPGFPMYLPPIDEQKTIAHILGTLDEKIELNRKTNETLEAMAKALFKSWFVDFDPVRAKAEGRPTGLPAEISDLFPDSFEDSELGEIPSGWSVGEINQILNLQKDSLDPATAPDEAFDHYSIPAFDAGKYPAKELGSSIKSQKFLVGDGDLLVSKLNPSTPRVWIPFASSGRRAICSTEFLVCRTSSVFGRAYAYCLASSDAIVEALTGLAGGTSNSHQRIRPGDFLALPCCIGTEIVRSAFLDVVEPLLGKSLVLRTESRSLSTTRDALLPKLISGEIRIPDAEKMLEEMLT